MWIFFAQVAKQGEGNMAISNALGCSAVPLQGKEIDTAVSLRPPKFLGIGGSRMVSCQGA